MPRLYEINHGEINLLLPGVSEWGRLLTSPSTVLVGAAVAEDATVVSKLREAGAVLIGHANLSEWASMRSSY